MNIVKPVRIVIAAVAAFRDRRASELAAPHDQRLVEQSPPLQIADQRGRRPIHVRAALAQVLVDLLVIVPGLARPVVHDDEADAALDEAARHQAPLRVRRRAVLLAHRLGLLHHVERVHRRELHLERRFHRRDAPFEERVLAEAVS